MNHQGAHFRIWEGMRGDAKADAGGDAGGDAIT